MEKILEDLEHEIRFKKLKDLGWKFMMSGPNEFTWLKFDKDGKCIAQQCDAVWAADHEKM